MTTPDKQTFFLPQGYVSRLDPGFDDHDKIASHGAIWQADVYRLGSYLAHGMRVNAVIDVGMGHGEKLAQFADAKLRIAGVDTEENAAWCRAHYAFGDWYDANFETGLPDLSPELVRDALVICSDVVEHLVDPMPLLHGLRTWLERGARALLLSTPDRVAVYGPDHLGPPGNPNHVREWTADEFGRLLDAAGLSPLLLGHTMSNDVSWDRSCTIALVLPDARARRSTP